jgi:hypothetical protein
MTMNTESESRRERHGAFWVLVLAVAGTNRCEHAGTCSASLTGKVPNSGERTRHFD